MSSLPRPCAAMHKTAEMQPKNMTHQEYGARRSSFMDELIAGYRRFRSGTWAQQRVRFEELSRGGQQPRTMLIACSDSRADPQMIFDTAPGALFVVRNVANLMPPYSPDSKYHGTSAALEFGVRVLKVA